MKVFRVNFDVNRYQSLLPVDEKIARPQLDFDCTPRAESWHAPAMRVPNPALPAPDLWEPASAAIAAAPPALERVRTIFEMAGELLPLRIPGVDLTVLNVTCCVDALDEDRCTWIKTRDGRRIMPNRFAAGSYVFHPDRFDEPTLFKIPQTRRTELLCLARDGDPEHELPAAVEKFALTGVGFILLWES
jgi:hypothetical protein